MRWKFASNIAIAIGALSTPLAAQTGGFVITMAPEAAPVDTSADWSARRAQLLRMIDRDIQALQFDRPHTLSVRQGTITFTFVSANGAVLSNPSAVQDVFQFQMAPKNGNCPKERRLREN